jgi:hypothetical protein
MPRRTWKSWEIKVLLDYPQAGTSLAAVLGRTEDSVTSMARKLGLKVQDRVARQVAARKRSREQQEGTR